MPQFNFKPQFAAAVEAGEKRQTVRARRAYPPSVGATAYLFSGMRTAACRRLGEHTITRVEAIEIDADGVIRLPLVKHEDGLYALSDAGADRFAQADGFATAAELVGWINSTHGLPFTGTVTYW